MRGRIGAGGPALWLLAIPGLTGAQAGVAQRGRNAAGGSEGRQVPVVWRVEAPLPEPPAPGREFRVTVTAEVIPGWHLYALDEPEGGPVPLEFSVPAGGPATLVSVGADRPMEGRTAGSAEPMMFYVGKVHFWLRLRGRPGADKGTPSEPGAISVRYQACNDRLCLAPRVASLPFVLPLPVR